jgi:hypothetical protein
VAVPRGANGTVSEEAFVGAAKVAPEAVAALFGPLVVD